MARVLPNFCLFIVAASPGVLAQELPGCKDMKLFTRPTGCVIAECGAKRTDSVKLQITAAQQDSLDGPASFIRYTCSAPATLDLITTQVTPQLKKALFAIVYEDNEDATSRIATARKADHWIDVDASPVDSGGISFTMTSVEVGPAKPLSGEVCSEAGLVALPKGCVLSECSSKRRDTVEMRSTAVAQVALNGSIRSSGIACETTIATPQLFEAAQAALKAAGFETVFTEIAKPEYSWLTVRSGKRWVELMSFQDSDAISYQLTDVQAQSVQASEKPAPSPDAKAAPVNPPEPPPVSPVQEAAPVPPSPSPPSDEATSVSEVQKTEPAPSVSLIPPRPLRRAAFSVPPDLRATLAGETTVNLLVDVNTDGFVINAALAPGPQSKNAEKLAPLAVTNVLQWRFEPALQDGRPVVGQVLIPMRLQ